MYGIYWSTGTNHDVHIIEDMRNVCSQVHVVNVAMINNQVQSLDIVRQLVRISHANGILIENALVLACTSTGWQNIKSKTYGEKQWTHLQNMTNTKHILSTATKIPENDLTHTKMDTIMGVVGRHLYTEDDLTEEDVDLERDLQQILHAPLSAPHMSLSCLLFLNCAQVRHLFQEVYSYCIEVPNLVNDAPSIARNVPSFIEHRGVQSVFSLLAKLRGYYNVIS